MRKMNSKKMLMVMAFAIAGCMTGCGSNEVSTTETIIEATTEAPVEISVEEMGAAIKTALGDNYLPDMAYDAESLEGFYGLTADMYDSYFAETTMMSTQIDAIVIVKPKEGMEDTVKATLDAYLDFQINDSMQYPMNAIKVQASKVYEKNGLYYFIGLFGDTTEFEESDEAMLKGCQERVQTVIDTIDAQYQ